MNPLEKKLYFLTTQEGNGNLRVLLKRVKGTPKIGTYIAGSEFREKPANYEGFCSI